jgi:DNA-binding transcriptional LysR family regulator
MDYGMNLNLLRVFHVSARLLNFTRASRELHLTQPGISKHIKALEEHYGVRLFDRLGKRMVLTQAGELLSKATQKMFDVLDESKARIDELRGLTGGKLNIGASVMIGTYILPQMLAAFSQKYGEIELTVGIGLSREIEGKVLSNELEIGFLGHRPLDDRLVATKFKTDRLVLAVSKKHAWAKRKSPVNIKELIDQPFLIAKPGSGTRNFIEDLLGKIGVTLKKAIEFGNTEGVKKAVEANLGVSIISKHAVQQELRSGSVKAIPLGVSGLTRDLYVVYRRDKYLSPATHAFLRLVG